MNIRIITDDLTSALDGTACFAERGWDTAVLTRQDSTADAQVLSLDTDTRERAPGRTDDPVSDAARTWRDADLLVLQFDSTLRGRVAQDCLRARAASGCRGLVIAPAFPGAGRATEGGRVLVEGVPVHETSFGRDPTRPVTESSIPVLFEAHGGTVTVARNADHAAQVLDSSEAVVVDARTEQDLDALVARLAGRKDLLWAGSTGLLRALARTLPAPSGAQTPDLPRAARPWLVVGSLNPRSRQQLAIVRHQRPFTLLATDAQRLPGGEARVALDRIAQQMALAVDSGACDGLIVTGGETARRIVDSLPTLSLRVCREVLPGVPLAGVRLADRTLPMITKAGGFGGEDALVTCIDALVQM